MIMLSRRKFIKSVAALGGAWLATASSFAQSVGREMRSDSVVPASTQTSPEGELYAGFLLLPEGAPVPSTVRYPEYDDLGALLGRFLGTAEDLAKEVGFPVRTFRKPPDGLRPLGAGLSRLETGQIVAASIDFESYNEATTSWETTVRICGMLVFPTPVPLWSGNSAEVDGPAVILQKVDFLPSSGIMVTTQAGYVFHWIEHRVFYTLTAEYGPSSEEARALADLLTLAG